MKQKKIAISIIILSVAFGYFSQSREFVIYPEIVSTDVNELVVARSTVIPQRNEGETLPLTEVVRPVLIEVEPTVDDVKSEIRRQARLFGLNEDMMIELADYESDFIWNNKNPVSTASGIYQFTTETFLDGIRWRGLDWTLKDREDYTKNINMAMWFIKKEESGRWRDAGIYLRSIGYNF